MEELEKNIRVNDLFDIYGTLLTDKQQKMITYYYQDDLSLGEISEVEEISRNAVHDALKKSINILEGYEEKLHLLERKTSLESYFYSLKETASKEQLELIKKIEKEVTK